MEYVDRDKYKCLFDTVRRNLEVSISKLPDPYDSETPQLHGDQRELYFSMCALRDQISTVLEE